MQFSDSITRQPIKELKLIDLQKEMITEDIAKPDVWLPILDGELMPPLFGLNSELLTEDVKDYVKEAASGQYLDILAQVPGSGKTCKLLAVSASMFTIFITCTDPIETGQKSRIFHDYSFQQLQENLDGYSNRFTSMLEATREVNIYYIARLAHLLICLQAIPDITPRDYLLLQINGNAVLVKEIYNETRRVLEPFSGDIIGLLLDKLALNVKTKTDTAFCIDEINVTAADVGEIKYVNVI
jgi:hypothetical protein